MNESKTVQETLKKISNKELLDEIRLRIIEEKLEVVEWESAHGNSSTITDLGGKSGEEWVRMNFDEVLEEKKKRKNNKK